MEMEFYVITAYRKEWWAIISRLIQVFEEKKYSHCSILVKTNTSEIIYESEIPLSREIPYSKWLESYQPIKFYKMPVKPENQLEAQLFLKSLTGRPYSILQAILIGFGRISKPIAKFISKVVWNSDRFFECAEFVAVFQTLFCGANYEISQDAIGLREIEEMSQKLQTE